MTMQKAVLELSADVDEDNTRETAEFHMVGDLRVNPRLQIDHLLGHEGSNLQSILTSRSGEVTAKRQGYYLDLGAGRHTIEIDFIGWEGATDGDGNPVQWGVRSGADGGTANQDILNATGDDPLTQAMLLEEYVRRGEYDSRAEHAKLRFGEYSGGTNTVGNAYPSGLHDDYLHVVPISCNLVRDVENPESFDGSIILQEAASIGSAVDAIMELEWG